MVRIVTDSAADMLPEELERFQITAIPLNIHFGETTYRDGETLDKMHFYELLTSSEEFPKTSQPSPAEFEACFEAAKDAGDEVIAILLSSALSGTFQGAKIAKDMVEYDNIYLVDSLSATVGQRLLIAEAVKMRDAGCSAREIVEKLESMKSRIVIWASLDTLEYLHKGGRLSGAAASIGTLTNMKPIITVTAEGEVSVVKKCIGQKRSMEQILKLIDSKRPDSAYPMYCVYTYQPENCLILGQRMEAVGYVVEKKDYYNVGPTIGSHVGTGVCGVAYIAAE